MDGIEFDVWLEIVSSTHSLDEISNRIGIRADKPLSKERGSRGGKWTLRKENLWRLDSGIPGDQPLAQHLEALFERAPILRLRQSQPWPDEWRVSIVIGVFGDEAIWVAETEFPARLMESLGSLGISLSVMFYS